MLRLHSFLEQADTHQTGGSLVKWINSFEKKPQEVFIVHGEDSVCDSFAALLHDAYGYDTLAPYTGAVYDLAGNVEISHGNEQKKSRRTVVKRNQGVFARLVAAGQRLMTNFITHNGKEGQIRILQNLLTR